MPIKLFHEFIMSYANHIKCMHTHDIPTARYAGSAHMQDFPLNIITYAANVFRQYMTTFNGISNPLLLYYGYNPLLILLRTVAEVTMTSNC